MYLNTDNKQQTKKTFQCKQIKSLHHLLRYVLHEDGGELIAELLVAVLREHLQGGAIVIMLTVVGDHPLIVLER